MDKFEEKEMMKKTPFAKNIWYNQYNQLINYVPEKQWMVLKTTL